MADNITDFADAAILSACAAFNALQQRKAALFDTIPSDSERYFAIGAINVQQDPMVHRLAELRAGSAAALLARAQVLSVLENVQIKGDLPTSSWIKRLTDAVMRDLKTPPPTHGPA